MAGGTKYTVKAGDGYFRIAKSLFGNSRFAEAIAVANGNVDLHPGMVLDIPVVDDTRKPTLSSDFMADAVIKDISAGRKVNAQFDDFTKRTQDLIMQSGLASQIGGPGTGGGGAGFQTPTMDGVTQNGVAMSSVSQNPFQQVQQGQFTGTNLPLMDGNIGIPTSDPNITTPTKQFGVQFDYQSPAAGFDQYVPFSAGSRLELARSQGYRGDQVGFGGTVDVKPYDPRGQVGFGGQVDLSGIERYDIPSDQVGFGGIVQTPRSPNPDDFLVSQGGGSPSPQSRAITGLTKAGQELATSVDQSSFVSTDSGTVYTGKDARVLNQTYTLITQGLAPNTIQSRHLSELGWSPEKAMQLGYMPDGSGNYIFIHDEPVIFDGARMDGGINIGGVSLNADGTEPTPTDTELFGGDGGQTETRDLDFNFYAGEILGIPTRGGATPSSGRSVYNYNTTGGSYYGYGYPTVSSGGGGSPVPKYFSPYGNLRLNINWRTSGWSGR